VKEEIKKILQQATGLADIALETPKEKTHGDYSSNVALVLAKKSGKDPLEVANEIIAKIGKQKFIEKVEVAGPGFINFYLSCDFFVDELKKVGKNFGRSNSLKSKKVIVEYTDPNILKEFHIGHLMSNAIGESISRIFEFQGAKVKRANYQSDVGMHVAKAIYGKMKNSLYAWPDAYVFGAQKYEADEAAKKEMVALNKKIFSARGGSVPLARGEMGGEHVDAKAIRLYDEGKKWSLKYFEGVYKKLGTKFDYYFLESQVADFGKKIVEEGLKKGIFETGERGAIIFEGGKSDLHTRVFINSEGLPTYEAKELGLANVKYKKYAYDTSVIVTGNEINEYFKVLMAAMAEVFPELQKKTKHIGHGMLRLPEGKMSSRTGKVVTFEFLLNEVEKLVKEKIASRDFSEKEKEEIIEKVAMGAVKYSILKQSIGSDIIYDFEKSISFEGDSGPYLQYSYVRAVSVLAKAKAEKVKASFKKTPQGITQLEKMMVRFSEVVEKAGETYEPHVITLYLTELAREFNNYYAHNVIVNKKDEFSPYKVALTQAFAQVIKNGLWLLGINAPEKM